MGSILPDILAPPTLLSLLLETPSASLSFWAPYSPCEEGKAGARLADEDPQGWTGGVCGNFPLPKTLQV